MYIFTWWNIPSGEYLWTQNNVLERYVHVNITVSISSSISPGFRSIFMCSLMSMAVSFFLVQCYFIKVNMKGSRGIWPSHVLSVSSERAIVCRENEFRVAMQEAIICVYMFTLQAHSLWHSILWAFVMKDLIWAKFCLK